MPPALGYLLRLFFKIIQCLLLSSPFILLMNEAFPLSFPLNLNPNLSLMKQALSIMVSTVALSNDSALAYGLDDSGGGHSNSTSSVQLSLQPNETGGMAQEEPSALEAGLIDSNRTFSLLERHFQVDFLPPYFVDN